MPKRIYLQLLTLALVLSACGWHLRGTGPNALANRIESVHVVNNGAVEVASYVITLLVRSGIGYANRENAQVVVSLGRELYDRRVLSVDPDTGKVSEYEVGYQIMLTVMRGDGTLVVENEPVELIRDYIFDETAVLGTFAEEAVLKNEIREEAAESIVRRLASLQL